VPHRPARNQCMQRTVTPRRHKHRRRVPRLHVAVLRARHRITLRIPLASSARQTRIRTRLVSQTGDITLYLAITGPHRDLPVRRLEGSTPTRRTRLGTYFRLATGSITGLFQLISPTRSRERCGPVFSLPVVRLTTTTGRNMSG